MMCVPSVNQSTGDQVAPVCGRCQSAGQECVRGLTYRFHSGKNHLKMRNSLILIMYRGICGRSEVDRNNQTLYVLDLCHA